MSTHIGDEDKIESYIDDEDYSEYLCSLADLSSSSEYLKRYLYQEIQYDK